MVFPADWPGMPLFVFFFLSFFLPFILRNAQLHNLQAKRCISPSSTVCLHHILGGKRLSPSAWTERSGVASVAAVKRPFSGAILLTHPSIVVYALIVVVCVFSDAIVSQECQNSFRMKSKSLDKNGLPETIFPTPTCIY